jgi:hypothetical protein
MRFPLLSLALLVSACGGSTAAPAATPSPPVALETSEHADADVPTTLDTHQEAPPDAAAEPLKLSFPDHGGVEAAIKSVPRGAPRLNMSNDALQGPLLDMHRYERCSVPRTTKVTLTVAVFDGSAVGVDVVTKPNNAKLNDCLDRVVREMSWDKVPSLNQVTVSF